jgi:predicted RNA-binding protein with EMAP domain
MRKSKDFLEWEKENLLEDLEKISHRINSLISSYSKRENMDNETRKSIKKINKIIMPILNSEIDRELIKQKADGKIFLSNEDVDELFELIGKEGHL